MKTNQNDKIKHLEFIEGVINRLSSNTFLFKGWSITVIGFIFTAMISTKSYDLSWLILGVVLMFWSIDAYYLALERKYRDLYNKVTVTDPSKIDFQMKTPAITFCTWASTLKRPILVMFYGVVLVTIIIFIINNYSIGIIFEGRR